MVDPWRQADGHRVSGDDPRVGHQGRHGRREHKQVKQLS